MNRIITILVTIFILLLLYIWISHVWGSDKPKQPRQVLDAVETDALGTDDSSSDETMALSGEYPVEEEMGLGEEMEEETPTVSETVPSKKELVNTSPAIPEKEEVKKAEPKKEPLKTESKPEQKPSAPVTKTSQPIAKPSTVIAPGDGKHLVIVGNFLQRVNADQRLQELKKAGFNDVEVVNFDLSEYHTVCAGRFDDINEARRLVKKLKDYHKIDAYVRIGS